MTIAVLAIGDSVMQGAGPDLYATLPLLLPGIEVDAIPNRQFFDAPPLLGARLAREPRPDVVVVHLGTNGVFAEATFDELIVATDSTAAPTVVVTIKAPRDWESDVNTRLREGVVRHSPRTTLLDWCSLATMHPDYLRPDGFHLSRIGALAYAAGIAEAVQFVTTDGCRRAGGEGPSASVRSFRATIPGGTSEIQRNIIAERVLGLPRA